eukprot:9414966-Alexandrium_andersonii.AAC.1
MKGSPQKLRDHLRANASVLNTCEAGRAAAMAFVNAGKTFVAPEVRASSSKQQQSTPMEVDARDQG